MGRRPDNLIGFPEMASTVASIMELRVGVAGGPMLAQSG